jgi:hypothetical protein
MRGAAPASSASSEPVSRPLSGGNARNAGEVAARRDRVEVVAPEQILNRRGLIEAVLDDQRAASCETLLRAGDDRAQRREPVDAGRKRAEGLKRRSPSVRCGRPSYGGLLMIMSSAPRDPAVPARQDELEVESATAELARASSAASDVCRSR